MEPKDRPPLPDVAALEAQAATRRHDGTYPPGIDDHLTAEFAHRRAAAATQTTALRAAIDGVRAIGPYQQPVYRGQRRIKAVYDRLVDKVIGHAFADLVRQLEAHRVALDRLLDVLDDTSDPGGPGDPGDSGDPGQPVG